MELSESFPIVVQTDISDFYPRVNHHRLENALGGLRSPGDAPKRIIDFLASLSGTDSYGLPVGGPASRLLAELALNDVDTLLYRHGVRFCRYADDYTIFCADKADAYRTLVYLSEKLANEGLVLQKKKTRIVSAEEFRETAQMLDPAEANDKLATEEQKLLNLRISFDPYSPSAFEDYKELKDAVSHVDIIGILGREIAKTAIDPAVSKQAIQAISVLAPEQQELAILMLLETTKKNDNEKTNSKKINNLETLSPVFVTIMRIVRDIYPTCSPQFQADVDEILCNLYDDKFPSLSVEVNLAYYLQALACNRTDRKEQLIDRVYTAIQNPLIRRLVVLTMAKWDCRDWLRDKKYRYDAMTIFEKRAFLIASFHIGEGGEHWQRSTKRSWKDPELFIRDWYSGRDRKNLSVPL